MLTRIINFLFAVGAVGVSSGGQFVVEGAQGVVAGVVGTSHFSVVGSNWQGFTHGS